MCSVSHTIQHTIDALQAGRAASVDFDLDADTDMLAGGVPIPSLATAVTRYPALHSERISSTFG